MSWGWGMGMGGGGMRGGAGGGGMRGALAYSDEDLGKVFEWRLMKRLIAYVRPYRARAFAGFSAMLVLQACLLAQPRLIGFAVDHMRSGDRTGLFVMVGLFLTTSLLSWLSQFQQTYQMTHVGQYALFDLAAAMFRRVSSLSLAFFDSNETGRIMSRVQNDVTVLQNFLSQGLI